MSEDGALLLDSVNDDQATGTTSVPNWGGEPVPLWAYDQHCADYEKNHLSQELEHVSTLAWKPACQALIILWSFWALFPVVAYLLAQCNDAGFATAPSWLLLLYLPVLVVSLFKEMRCYACILPVHVRWLGPYKVMNTVVPFRLWYFIVLAISAAAHMDLATSGLFLGRLLKTAQCEDSKVNDIWDQVAASSVLKWLPSLHLLGIGLWLVMAAQLCCAVGYGVPDNWSDFTLGMQATECQAWCPDSFFGGRVYGNDLIEAVAEGSRMTLVNFRATAFMRHPDRNSKFSMMTRDMWWEYRGAAAAQIQRNAVRLTCFLLFESCLQPNLQASVLAVEKATTEERDIDYLTVVSVCLCLVMALYNVVNTGLQQKSLVQHFWAHRHLDCDDSDRLRRNSRRAICGATLFCTSALACLAFIVYAFAKMIVAVFFCQDGVWNISGCVHIQHLY